MRGGKSAVLGLAGAALAFALGAVAYVAAAAGTDEGPYRAITERNIFDLQPIPPPAPPPPPAKPPGPNVKLVGIMTITGHPQAVVWMQPFGDPNASTKIYDEGERIGDIQVLSIDVASAEARIQVGDDATTYKVEEKPGSGPPPAAAARGPGGLVIPRARAGGPGPSAFSPVQQPRYNGAPVANQAAYNPSDAYAAAANNGAVDPLDPTTIPARPVRTDTSTTEQITPEQQMINMEQQRDEAVRAGSPIANLIPPTKLGAMMPPITP